MHTRTHIHRHTHTHTHRYEYTLTHTDMYTHTNTHTHTGSQAGTEAPPDPVAYRTSPHFTMPSVSQLLVCRFGCEAPANTHTRTTHRHTHVLHTGTHTLPPP